MECIRDLSWASQSGGEFGVFAPVDTPGFGLPGRFGVDYAFINKVLMPSPLTLSAHQIFEIGYS